MMQHFLVILVSLIIQISELVASYDLEQSRASDVDITVSSIYSPVTDIGSSKYDVSMTTSGSLIYRIFLGASSLPPEQTRTPKTLSVTEIIPPFSLLKSSMDLSGDTMSSATLSFAIASPTEDPTPMLLTPIDPHNSGDASSSAASDVEESIQSPSISGPWMSLNPIETAGTATSRTSYDYPIVPLHVVTTPATPTSASFYDPRISHPGIFWRRADLNQASEKVFEIPGTGTVDANAIHTIITLAVPTGVSGSWVAKLTYSNAASPSQQPGPTVTVPEFTRAQTQTICFNQTTAIATIAVPSNIAGVWISALTLSMASSGKHCPGNYPPAIRACMAQYTKPFFHGFSANYTTTIPAGQLSKRFAGSNQADSTSVVVTSWTVTTSGPHWGTSVAKAGAKTGECNDEESCRKRCEDERRRVWRLIFILLPLVILPLLATWPVLHYTRAHKKSRNIAETSNTAVVPLEQLSNRAGTVLDGPPTCATSTSPIRIPDTSGPGSHANMASRMLFSRTRAGKVNLETSRTVPLAPLADSPVVSSKRYPLDVKVLSGPENHDPGLEYSTRPIKAPLRAELDVSNVNEIEPTYHSYRIKDALGALCDKFHGRRERESSNGDAPPKYLDTRASAATFPRSGNGAFIPAHVRSSSEYADRVADGKTGALDAAAGHMRAVPVPSRCSPPGSRRGRVSRDRAAEGPHGGVWRVTGSGPPPVERGRSRRRAEVSGSVDE